MILRNLSMLLIQLLASIPIFAAEPAKPNFLIIVADDLGYSDLGCYGGEIDTPNLDTLAAEGVKYTNFYNTARCWTSRSALVCGYHHTQLGVEPNLKKYPSWIRSFASLLKEAGYKSYHSGKWHVTPLKRAVADGGFDESYLIDDHDRNFNPRIIIEKRQAASPRQRQFGLLLDRRYNRQNDIVFGEAQKRLSRQAVSGVSCIYRSAFSPASAK